MTHRLWYQQPASHWEEGLPLGNGRLGAMELGGGADARIALNEDTLWSGYPKDTNRKGPAAHYPVARDLALNGRLHEVQTLIERDMLGGFTQSYMPLGDLRITHTNQKNERYIRRELSLSHAVHTTEYAVDGVRIVRETFVSHPAQAVFVRIRADKPASLNVSIQLTSQLKHTTTAAEETITLDTLAPSNVVPSYLNCDDPVHYFDESARRGMRCRAELQAISTGGAIAAHGTELCVTGADTVELRITARTSFNGFDTHPYLDGKDEKALCSVDRERLQSLGWDQALAEHITDHRGFFDRMELTLGEDPYDDLPTDRRLRDPQPDDLSIFALLFHFGRYLLIACSRPGTQAANLQGIWNQDLRPAWSCNYTLNINLQMNYWMAEAAALPETAEPLHRLIEDLCKTGSVTAREHYAVRGAVAHHNTDIWRLSNPVGEQHKGFAGCAFWPLAIAWLCRHMMERWRYSGNDTFLSSRALPIIRQAVRFALDVAAPDKEGYLTIAPATSPENTFLYESKQCKVTARATMTTEILRELFGDYLTALNALHLTESMAQEARDALLKLPPRTYGSRGQMLEWEQEYEEDEPHHRHVSQLYGLYPGSMIAADSEDAEACRQTLRMRGDDGTGWSLAWKAALWARLNDGDHALCLLRQQLRPVQPGLDFNLTHGGSYISLLCAHPPFQIDGNFGACAAILEMLLRADGDTITLLPALPAQWPQGEVRGLRAPQNIRVSFRFAQGRVYSAEIENPDGARVTLCINDDVFTLGKDAMPTSFRYPAAE